MPATAGLIAYVVRGTDEHECVHSCCMFQPASRILLLTDSLVSDQRNPLALEKAVGAALSFGKVEIALALLQEMRSRRLELRPHYFWPLFIAASKSDGEKGWHCVQILLSIFINNPLFVLSDL
jgi:hypothetical protein